MRAGGPVPLVPHYSHGRSEDYPEYYRADKRRKYGGLKAKVVDFETTAWLPSSVPAIELDEAVINALIGMAGHDQRQVFMCQAQTAAEQMRQEMYATKVIREKDLAEVRRKLKRLVDTTDRARLDRFGRARSDMECSSWPSLSCSSSN